MMWLGFSPALLPAFAPPPLASPDKIGLRWVAEWVFTLAGNFIHDPFT